jgi:tetratricopeptide (TPR) repeat protein
MKQKGLIIGVLLIIVVIGAGIGVRYFIIDREQTEFARQLAALGGGGDTPETIENLKAAIKLYESEIDRITEYAGKTGLYYKILANRLQEQNLHGEALEALQQAIHYTPADPALLWMTGVSATFMGRSALDFDGTDPNAQERYYLLAENAFKESIAMDENYVMPLLGIGNLYVFYMDRPADAIPYLETYQTKTNNDTDCMFILARAYFVTGRYWDAISLYDKIISITNDPATRAQAEENKALAEDQYFG